VDVRGLQGLFCEPHTCVYVERQWMYAVYMDCSVSLIHVCVERQWMYGVYKDCSVSLIHVWMLKGSGCTGLQGLFCEPHTCVYVERQWMYGSTRIVL